MNSKEKLIDIIRKIVIKETNNKIEIAEMISDTDIKLKGLEIKKPLLYFIETCTVDINTKMQILGEVKTGGGGESPHTHPFSYQDTSVYINKLKAGDKVAVYRLNKGKFLVLGKVV